MNDQISAVAQTLTIYLFMAVAYYGWGKALVSILGVDKETNHSHVMLIWLGWASTLVVLQVIHFWFPLTAYVSFATFFLGILFSVPLIARDLRSFARNSPSPAQPALSIMALLVAAVWIGSRSMLDPTNYDSGLYHFNAIRWINSLPLIPGLGNVHGRLAYNQSFYTYVAALNFYPFLGHGRSLANSFLLLLTLATFVHSLLPVFRKPTLLIESHPFEFISALLALPIILYLALSTENLASPSPDLASTLLQLAIFVIIAQGIASGARGADGLEQRSIFLAILAATAVTIKLSNLAYSASIILLCLASAGRNSTNRPRTFLRLLLPVLVIFLVWTARGIVQSGCPAFPSTVGCMSFDWAVPRERVQDEANWIFSWARQPDTHPSNVLGKWEWLGPWIKRTAGSKVDVVHPLALSILFGIFTVMKSRPLCPIDKGSSRHPYLGYTIILPSVIGIIYWFFTAPDPRFAHALFWCLALGSALIFLSSVKSLLSRRSYILILSVVVVAVSWYPLYQSFKRFHNFKVISSSGWHPVKSVPLSRKQTASGLIVYVPEQGDQCWDSPLPCTPYFNASLRLRNPADTMSGFTVPLPQKN